MTNMKVDVEIWGTENRHRYNAYVIISVELFVAASPSWCDSSYFFQYPTQESPRLYVI